MTSAHTISAAVPQHPAADSLPGNCPNPAGQATQYQRGHGGRVSYLRLGHEPNRGDRTSAGNAKGFRAACGAFLSFPRALLTGGA